LLFGNFCLLLSFFLVSLFLDHFSKRVINVILVTLYLSLNRRGQGHLGAEEDDIFLLKYSLYIYTTLSICTLLWYLIHFHSNCCCECYVSQDKGVLSTCEAHQLVVRELISARDVRKILSVGTRTMYILSARTCLQELVRKN